MLLHRLSPLAALALLGCASGPTTLPPAPAWAFASATPSAGNELRMHAQDKYIQVSLDGNNIYGASFSLSHSGIYIRGTGSGGSPIDVKLQTDHATGIVRSQPLTVDLSPETGGVTRVTGLFAGSTSDFRISPALFQGKLGSCSYEYTWTGMRYEGKVSCSGGVQDGSLELPVAMAAWTNLEVATVLAIVLGT
ncbi:MAG TPA: hypothetical protein VEJ89_04695 [Myxococcaceae bacterium]|jgi:hypothetical protein|nr:hypothetical protein [Myxococcaceae bacterium]